MNQELNGRMRDLPSVDEVLQRLNSHCPRELLVSETRRVIDSARARLKRGERVDIGSIPRQVIESLSDLERPSLRRVINATGVVLHTNLGRAPIGPGSSAQEGYSNLEYDLTAGRRGKRDTHVTSLIERLTSCPGIVVNNNAAAVWLVLNELSAGHEAIVSRGELIEIGDGFRIPDIMARSGAILREVGTTNRTRIEDYRDAINDKTRLILRVHPSNFHMSGFTARPELSDLAALARECNLTLYEDLGSGCLVDLRPWGIQEPLVSDSLRAGVHLVTFSGDKLLGGPQAGIIAGDQKLVLRCRQNPMFRALRVDKLILGALENTLRQTILCNWAGIPALQMISMGAERLRERSEAFCASLRGIDAEVRSGSSVIGGGSTPDASLPGWLVSIGAPDVVELERRLRAGDPPVVARIEDGRLALDLRTVFEHDETILAGCLMSAISQPPVVPLTSL